MTPKLIDIPIDRSSPMPLYHQVAQGLESMIRAGTLEPGSRLENEIELANRLNLSRPTMRKAMDELVRAGLLVRKRGVGTQVVSNQVRRPLELSSLNDDLLRTGQKPSTQVLSFSHGPGENEQRQALNLPTGVGLYHFSRLRSVDGKPLALMENWVRDDAASLTEEALGSRGMYEILRSAGVNFRLAHQRIGATVANAYQAELLGCEPGSPLVTMERTAVDDMGQNIETGHHVYRADSYTFEMTLVQR